MTLLADEIVKVLGRRRKEKPLALDAAEVDKVLGDLGIPTSASKGMPVHLRVARVSFSGTKLLNPGHPDAGGAPLEAVPETGDEPRTSLDALNTGTEGGNASESSDIPHDRPGESDVEDADSESPIIWVPVPFEFTWTPTSGVNGVGSSSNLRGKSSLVEVLLWSLSGRCAVNSVAVRHWIEHVEVDWVADTETLRVAFDADDGAVCNGSVSVIKDGSADLEIAAFGDDETFEQAMSSVMLGRLRLESFTVSQAGKSVTHKWASYVNALYVRPSELQSVIGKEPTLSVRLMQMFIGTDWVPVLATASTVAGSLGEAQKVASERSTAMSDAMAASHAAAQTEVEAVEAKIAALPVKAPNPAALAQVNAQIGELTRQMHAQDTLLLDHTVAAEIVREQLKAAKARQHTEHEHALLTKFFHQMKPTVCPRCTAEVTDERLAAEPTEHTCSVCTSDLNLEALRQDVVVADSVDAAVVESLREATNRTSNEAGEEPEPKSEIDALEEALDHAETVLSELQQQHDQLKATRDDLLDDATLDAAMTQAVEDRRLLDIELARAQGAAKALAVPVAPLDELPVDPIQLAIAEAAEKVLRGWVKTQQEPLLKEISTEISSLALGFGADSLSDVKLDGAANMLLRQNGDRSTYGQVTPGERLRLKIATMIALIKHGYGAGIGRHPGFLVLDSPAAEEIPDGDLATMVSALLAAADETPMQIIVSTRSTGPLEDLLPEENRLIAEGDSFLW